MVKILVVLPLFFLAFASARKIRDKEYVAVFWKDKHTFNALSISLTSGITHEIEFWRDDHRSRKDYKNGISKVFQFDKTVPGTSRYGTKYQVHPVANEDDQNEIVCFQTQGKSKEKIRPDDLLPATYHDYELVGHEIITEKEVDKLYAESVDEETDKTYKYTLWTFYDNDTSSWIPVRFEEVAFSNWYGLLKDHNIWEFYNYATNFSDDVFDYKKFAGECMDMVSGEEKKEIENETEEELDLNNEAHIDKAFEKFKKTFDRKYTEDDDEHAMRRKIFKKNLELVHTRNKKKLGYTLAINEYSDRTEKELFKRKGLLRRKPGEVGNIPFPYSAERVKDVAEDLPTEYDLRILGVVSPVVNQGDCGCCWTMGTTAAVEGALARSNGGRLLRLSNQALIDCAWSYGVAGCDGGSDTGAYKWMMKYGLPTVEEYGTYLEQDSYCLINNMTQLYPIRGFTDVTPFSVDALKVAIVNHGPLSVSVHATKAFQLYSGGIFYDPACDPTQLDHEVTIVGYGEKDGASFWILKNSWGTDWGIAGYMHISTLDNACGVTTEPTYVTI